MTIEISKLTIATNVVLSVLPGAVVGGSLGLHTRNMLSRLPNDIDIFYYNDWMPTELKLFEVIEPTSVSPFATDIFGEKIKRRSLLVHGVPVCLFTVPREQCKADFLFNHHYGFFMPVQYPVYAIEAKKQYYNRYGDEKHRTDLIEIRESYFKS